MRTRANVKNHPAGGGVWNVPIKSSARGERWSIYLCMRQFFQMPTGPPSSANEDPFASLYGWKEYNHRQRGCAPRPTPASLRRHRAPTSCAPLTLAMEISPTLSEAAGKRGTRGWIYLRAPASMGLWMKSGHLSLSPFVIGAFPLSAGKLGRTLGGNRELLVPCMWWLKLLCAI